MKPCKFPVGSIVYYRGEPILNPQRWDLIIVKTNGIVDLDEIALIIQTNEVLQFSTLFFSLSQIEIPRISHKYLELVE